MRNRTRVAALALITVVGLTGVGCGSTDSSTQSSTTDETTPEGYIEGAEEKPEAQISLAYTETGGRQLRLLNIETEETATIELTAVAQRLFEDGRFVYASSGNALEVVDSGGWTVDHTDHVHYYRAPSKSLGAVPTPASITMVAGSGTLTAIGTQGGKVVVVDRKALESGELEQLETLSTNSSSGFAVPYHDGLVVAQGSDPQKPATELVYSDARGTSLGTEQPCQDPQGYAILRNVVVVSCVEGIAMFTKSGSTVSSRLLPYGSRGPRAAEITFRPRSNYAAAPTAGGVWTVNSSARTLDWTASPEPMITAVTPGKDNAMLVLTTSGTLRSVIIGTVRLVATADQPGVTEASELTVDSSRAYLSAPATKQIYEIDYTDALRRARTFTTEGSPGLMVEVGR